MRYLSRLFHHSRDARCDAAVAVSVVLLAASAAVPAAAPAHNVFPATPQGLDGHYRFGAYPPESDEPRWWYESRFPGTRDANNRYKDAVRRGALAWSDAGATFRFVSNRSRELPYFVDPYYAPAGDDIRGTEDGEGRARYCDMFEHDQMETPEWDPVPASLVFWPELPAPPPTPQNPNPLPPLGEATTCNRVPQAGGDARPFKFFIAINRLYNTCADVTRPPETCRGGQWYRGSDPNRIPPNRFDLQSVAAHEFGHATGWGWHFDDDGVTSGDGEACRLSNPARETMCAITGRGSTVTRTLEAHDIHTFRGDANQPGAYPPR